MDYQRQPAARDTTVTEETLRLDIPVLLPEIPDARDTCVARLESRLRSQRGIHKAHISTTAIPPSSASTSTPISSPWLLCAVVPTRPVPG